VFKFKHRLFGSHPIHSGKNNPEFDEHFDLHGQDDHYRFLFEHNPLPVLIIDLDNLTLLEVNKAAVEFYGHSEKDLLNMKLTGVTYATDANLLEENIKKIRQDEPEMQRVWKHVKKNGETADVEITGKNFNYRSRRARLLVINDVTNSVKAEANLKRINEQYRLSNERYNIIANATHDLIWDWNLETNELYRDPKGLLEVYGVSNNETIRHINNWLERIHPEDLQDVQETIFDIINATSQNIFDIEYRFLGENGEYAYIYDRGYILRDNNGKAYRMIGAAQNITERKKLEQEILDQQKAISQATIDTQEKERTEISKELHDNVNQLLTTTKLYLDLALSSPELKDELVKKSSANISNAIAEIRTLSQSLMIPSLGDLGLVDSIEDLVENMNITKKINAVFVCKDLVETDLNDNQKLALFRIVQEAFNNVVKHAEATLAIVEIKNQNDLIELMIKDNGKGFDVLNSRKGAGLNNIRNRVYLLDGELTIDTQPGKGCTLVVELPLHH